MQRVTITLPDDLVEAVRREVDRLRWMLRRLSIGAQAQPSGGCRETAGGGQVVGVGAAPWAAESYFAQIRRNVEPM
ncbi:MAG TPA: hypothetical protein VGS58_00035 [Candidatus Sulfopaludibacter sp.]|nr:hypothetical protein [Candidatus Sulfopaludibacter sp.]